ncbi:MAG: ABC transporter permease [Deltaproteobacteria bacterium]|nr:ABC transporter permease [Deltaproteobacteria bacterium]
MADTLEIKTLEITERRRERNLWNSLRKMLRIPLAVFGLVVIFIVITCAIFAPWLAPHDPLAMDMDALLSGPTWKNPLGADQMGRDTLSRLIYGSRIALLVSFGAVSLGVILGVPIGLISAYYRGKVDEVIMRFMDALVAFPSLILAVGLIAVLGSSIQNVIFAIGVANIPWLARVVRSQALSVREMDYVMSARSIGASNTRIISRYLWPNCAAPVIVQATLGMAYAVLAEAALGFIGVGVQPPTPTWGNMLQYAFGLLDRSPILSIAPGLAIFFMVLAFNFVGDAVRDVLDPRLRGLLRD